MKSVVLSFIVFVLLPISTVKAQHDSLLKGSMHFKSIRIIGNDTIVDERHIGLDPSSGNGNFFFRFGDEGDTLMQGYGETIPDSDSILQEYLTRPFGRQFLPSDSGQYQFRFRFPDTDMQGANPFGFDFKQISPDIFPFQDGMPGSNFFSFGRTPSFSVEDVEIYPENNTIKDFDIKAVPGTPILIVQANLDNKKSVYNVYDNRGNTIHNEKIRKIEGSFRRVLRLDEMKSGTYFVEIKNGKSTKKKRITIR